MNKSQNLKALLFWALANGYTRDARVIASAIISGNELVRGDLSN